MFEKRDHFLAFDKFTTFSGVQLQSSRKGQTSLNVAKRVLRAFKPSSQSKGPKCMVCLKSTLSSFKVLANFLNY